MHTPTTTDAGPIAVALDRLDDEVAGYGRAIETAMAARAARCARWRATCTPWTSS